MGKLKEEEIMCKVISVESLFLALHKHMITYKNVVVDLSLDYFT